MDWSEMLTDDDVDWLWLLLFVRLISTNELSEWTTKVNLSQVTWCPEVKESHSSYINIYIFCVFVS